MKSNILDVELSHQYKSGFSLDIEFSIRNQITSIFGSSGSGKTSILSMIMGLKKPKYGKIVLNGRLLYDSNKKINVPVHQRRIGMIFQEHLLFPHYNVEQNLKYGLRKNKPDHAAPDFNRVCEVLEISHLLARYPRFLSGGECQRVAIGRTLLSSPEALLMDEPLASIDERLRNSILNYFERVIKEWNIPAIFISHNQSLVQRFSSHTIVINQGKVLSSGLTSNTIEKHGPDIWKSSKGPINLLKVDSLEHSKGFSFAIILGQRILLPGVYRPSDHKMYIQFSANDVVLSKNPQKDISSRNHIYGTVMRFVEQESYVLVAIDIGKVIWSKITLAAKHELELEIGISIYCLIKTQSLECIM